MSLKMINIQKYLFFVMMLVFSTLSFAQKKQNFVIVIDAGHGGKDVGARGVADYEKNITLDVSKRLAELIKKNHKDVKVILTRDTDVFLELWERTKISNDNHANLFVSIHCNSADNKSATGTETFVMGLKRSNETDEVSKRENSVVFLEKDQERYEKFNPNDPEAVIAFEIMNAAYKEQSIRFADLVEKGFVNRDFRKSRGVKQANFHVLRGNASPSVLVELGFISNYDEGNYLASNEGKEQSSQTIYEAFKQFKKEYDRRSGIEYEEEKPKSVKKVEKPVLDDDKDGVINELDKCPNTPAGYTVDTNGCTNKINLEVLFENNSSVVKEDTKEKVLAFAKYLVDNKEFKTVITGHASKENRTSALYNQKLSLDRASAIKDLLVLNGVESSRIQAVGKGFDEPIASNDTQEGQAKNRRIEAELIKIQK